MRQMLSSKAPVNLTMYQNGLDTQCGYERDKMDTCEYSNFADKQPCYELMQRAIVGHTSVSQFNIMQFRNSLI